MEGLKIDLETFISVLYPSSFSLLLAGIIGADVSAYLKFCASTEMETSFEDDPDFAYNFWNMHAEFHELMKIAHFLTRVHLTSASVEHLFSKAGALYGDSRRSRLSTAKAEMFLVIGLEALQKEKNVMPNLECEEEVQDLYNSFLKR
ncbi:unnamed protein product, partial [Mesorhabditis belari]|uniref:HAT C-terminal dimerisation domain-containing protein n=1 Tax=Mesorhabditis belari TaxID=2138241 RepID=A0AAF3F7C9_9BILA